MPALDVFVAQMSLILLKICNEPPQQAIPLLDVTGGQQLPTQFFQFPVGLGTVMEHRGCSPVALIIRAAARDWHNMIDRRKQLPIDHVRFAHLPIGDEMETPPAANATIAGSCQEK